MMPSHNAICQSDEKKILDLYADADADAALPNEQFPKKGYLIRDEGWRKG